jgi:nucleoid-associated protein YgaU
MRKDVKLGFAIGGVLLAVVIVYVLVVSGGDNKSTQVALTTQDTSTSTSAGDKSTAPTADQTSDPFKSTPTVAAPTTAPSSESDKPKPDDKWSAALNTGKLPVMMTETPSPTAPKSSEIAQADPPTSTTPPIMASNMPASVESSEHSPATQPSDSRTHVVQSGETFSSIAASVYGSAAYYPHLIRANPTIDPRKLRAGMKINVPPMSDVKADSSASTSSSTPSASSSNAPLDDKTEYRVQSGDTLSKISTKLFGRRSYADKIYQLNQSTIGSDPGRLKVGMVLKLPEAPTAKS